MSSLPRSVVRALLLGALLLALLLSASDALADDSGHIIGGVTSASTGQPGSGFTVTAYQFQGRSRKTFESQNATPVVSARTVALFGDSTFQTFYLDTAENPSCTVLPAGYDGRLHRVLSSVLRFDHGIDARVTNWGTGGMDSRQALSSGYPVERGDTASAWAPARWTVSAVTPWADCLATLSPGDLVVINFGANDFAHHVSVEDLTRSITTMVTQARANDVTPVLATCLDYDYPAHFSWDYPAELGPYSDAIKGIATRYHLALADDRAAFKAQFVAGNWSLFGRNDATYLPAWEDGSVPGSLAYYSQSHPWVAGVWVMAQAIAVAAAPSLTTSAQPLVQTTPSLTRSPPKSSLTYPRGNGVAKYTLSVTLSDSLGSPIEGLIVYLQSSANGKKWRKRATLGTNWLGMASRAFKSKTKSTTYYRWNVPATPGCRSVISGNQKVVVK